MIAAARPYIIMLINKNNPTEVDAPRETSNDYKDKYIVLLEKKVKELEEKIKKLERKRTRS